MKGVLVPRDPSAAAQRRYRSLQCTSCHALGEGYGLAYRLFAGPDLVLYHALADALAGGSAPLSFRSCVVAPGITRLPVHARTRGTTLATAFAVWMGLEKLADDVTDEGSWLGWLATRAFARGHRRARAILEANAFPVEPIRDALARQQQLEAGSDTALERALEPTRTIGGLAFGALGEDAASASLGRAIGERVATVLFWLDNALDLPGDLAAGRYNALARARALDRSASHEQLRDARAEALVHAHQALDGLEPLLLILPGRVAAELVHSGLVHGLRTQLASLEALDDAAWPTSTARTLQVWRPPLSQVLARRLPEVAERLRVQARRAWYAQSWRARAAISLLAAWVFPQRAWAQSWWPEEPPPVDTALPPPEVALDGVEVNQFDEGSERTCDVICGSFGSCDLSQTCDDCCTCEG